MAKIRLTKQIVERIKPGARDKVIWDSEVPGFGVKVTSAGRRVYFCYFRTLSGQQRRPSIGVHGAISSAAARDIARTMLEDVRRGGDPGHERRVRLRKPNLPAYNVLLLEDHAFQRQIGVEVLKLCGATGVTAVTNGAEAIWAIKTADEPFDLLVCDLNMPGMDGLEFLRHIATAPSASSIILASGLDLSIIHAAELIAEGYGLRIVGAIEKPLSQSKLLPLILRHFGRALLKPTKKIELMPVKEIRAGVKRGEFEPFFQPKVSMGDCTLVGAEAVLRWHHPKRGTILPEAFVPVMEEHGLIEGVTLSVVEMALSQCRKWHDAGMIIPVSINISVKSLENDDLADRLEEMTRAAGLSPDRLTLEITETVAMIDLGRSWETLARLRMKGFGLSLDDFGAGFSSLQQLARIPFSELKIDQAFVAGAANEPVLLALLQNSVRMAKSLKLQSVAEGVESNEDWNAIAQLGCNLAQGHFVARPMPGDELSVWYQSWLQTLPIGKVTRTRQSPSSRRSGGARS